MSLDITLGAVRAVDVFTVNVTHNLVPMAEACGLYELMWQSQGRNAGELVEPLRAACAELVCYPEKYRRFNPENGWGSYEGLVSAAGRFLGACIENPDATVEISK